jgi:mRNA interferase MazF
MPIRRGEVYYVNLHPVVGREIGGDKSRPVVVLSIDDLNRKPLVVAVVPGTSAAMTHPFRNVVTVQPTPANGLSLVTNFLCHQVRAIDHSRFPAQAAGRLGVRDLTRIEEAVRFSLGLL